MILQFQKQAIVALKCLRSKGWRTAIENWALTCVVFVEGKIAKQRQTTPLPADYGRNVLVRMAFHSF